MKYSETNATTAEVFIRRTAVGVFTGLGTGRRIDISAIGFFFFLTHILRIWFVTAVLPFIRVRIIYKAI